jgi:serine/threonine-protein kinase Chk1
MKLFCLPFFGTPKTKKSIRPLNENRYDSLTVVKELKKSTFPVYLVYSQSSREHYAVKAFPFQDNEPHPSFKRELMVRTLSHPNIIRALDSVEKKENFVEGQEPVSYLLMELAPYGSFFELIWKRGLPKSETIARTYFHQLIDGIEYLHNRGIAHTDLKPENLLVGDQFILKIIDFERCKRGLVGKIPGRGTKNYRAPEVRLKQCMDPRAADVYSAGVILFVLLFHFHPYVEDKLIKGHDLQKLLLDNEDQYWTALFDCKGENSNCSEAFKRLIMGMVKQHPEERLTLGQIKASDWYSGPTLSKKDLKLTMNKFAKEVEKD